MKTIKLKKGSTVHLIGICGTGMGALAGLLTQRGYKVTGSDANTYPPMSTELESLGVTLMEGYRASNLDHRPDLVVVGNVCRPDHLEAMAAKEMGLCYASMPRTVHDLFLKDLKPFVVTGTHGKTTTTALLAYLLRATGRDPSLLVGGVTADFGSGYHVGEGENFVIEGDEYDSAYFEKVAKFLSYAPFAGIITSVEHDHVDIYPDFQAYKEAFASFARLVKAPGTLAVWGGDGIAVELAGHSSGNVITYGVEGDSSQDKIDWVARPTTPGRFDLMIDGRSHKDWQAPIGGNHNLRNTLAALILCNIAAGIPLEELREILPGFRGVARRQEVIGRPRNITVYDDFAHHPTAVKETLEALATLHPKGRLLAAFEPRSATACRRTHQELYTTAFDCAGLAVIAPPGRNLPRDERLDTRLLAEAVNGRETKAIAADSIDEVLKTIVEWARPGDGVALLSNGSFGGLGVRVLEALK